MMPIAFEGRESRRHVVTDCCFRTFAGIKRQLFGEMEKFTKTGDFLDHKTA